MQDINRREFLDRSKNGVVGLAASMPILAGSVAARAAQKVPKRRPTVVCVYYPHWHNYDHGSAWKGEGWTEWEGVEAAVPRFPGHHQPLKPTWGYFDASDPKWSAREIDLAADHGIESGVSYQTEFYNGLKKTVGSSEMEDWTVKLAPRSFQLVFYRKQKACVNGLALENFTTRIIYGH